MPAGPRMAVPTHSPANMVSRSVRAISLRFAPNISQLSRRATHSLFVSRVAPPIGLKGKILFDVVVLDAQVS
jgi:hypothetical protein